MQRPLPAISRLWHVALAAGKLAQHFVCLLREIALSPEGIELYLTALVLLLEVLLQAIDDWRTNSC